jgi:predicted transcriptional regulator
VSAPSTKRSAIHTTIVDVPAPPPLSLRLGRDGLNALDELARRRKISRSEAARQAIAETAERERRHTGLAAEAKRLMEDPAYIEEMREVGSLMEELRGAW